MIGSTRIVVLPLSAAVRAVSPVELAPGVTLRALPVGLVLCLGGALPACARATTHAGVEHATSMGTYVRVSGHKKKRVRFPVKALRHRLGGQTQHLRSAELRRALSSHTSRLKIPVGLPCDSDGRHPIRSPAPPRRNRKPSEGTRHYYHRPPLYITSLRGRDPTSTAHRAVR